MLQPVSDNCKQQTFGLESPVGYWSVTTTETHVLSVDYVGNAPSSDLRMTPQGKLEMRLACMLSRYFKGERIDFSRLPLRFPEDSNFLASVLQGLQSISYGECRDYQWLAEHIGNPKAIRAVGGALGRNPLPILLPCHRITSKNGLLGGFMRSHPEGSRVKAFLLGLEGIQFTDGKRCVLPEGKPSPWLEPQESSS